MILIITVNTTLSSAVVCHGRAASTKDPHPRHTTTEGLPRLEPTTAIHAATLSRDLHRSVLSGLRGEESCVHRGVTVMFPGV